MENPLHSTDILRPITSLIGKSEKAIQKLATGTWQHTMLQGNIDALRLAADLLNGEKDGVCGRDQKELREALHSLSAMIVRTEKAQVKFPPGTPHHTLLKNRLDALRSSKLLIANIETLDSLAAPKPNQTPQ